MRSLMIVGPDKLLDGATPGREGEERPDVETFVIDGAKNRSTFPFDCGA